MKIAFYPGSFNLWHEGHEDVVLKALKVFDKVVILQMSNADKGAVSPMNFSDLDPQFDEYAARIEILSRPNMSINSAIGNHLLGESDVKANQYAIIRGLRNEQDFCQEQIQQYHYEDMGIKIPVMYVISDRKLVHISSSALRAVKKFAR